MPFLQTLEERERYRETQAWKRIERLSVHIISDLLIPENLNLEFFTQFGLFNKLEWTSYGTVDLVRSAKVFIRDESLYVEHRFRLACDYCLEDDIPEIWAEVFENSSLYFTSNQENVWMDLLTYYWTCYAIEGSKCSERFSFEDICRYAYQLCSIVAEKYFFAKLSFDQKRHFASEKFNLIFEDFLSFNELSELKPFRETSDLLFMYFPFLTPSTQQYWMKYRLWVVMLSFANFPRTSSLMEIPRKYGNTLNLKQFYRISVLLFDRCIDEIDSFHHRGLFLTFLSECPQHFSIDNKVIKKLFARHLVRLMTFKFPFLLCGKTLQEKREIVSQGLNECNFKKNYEFDRES
ncbi:uncharacterized protein CEXT_770661 [Caerostris extrusa]|uniref:Uncharacterized protein n=1 Tax=Caerostris extrusa TaxID=172846 RepID=A0AAV4NFD6_CAEEX|nr:uncharacterized protein CEXT_770661 [Caerostris extrusa]